MIGNTFRKSKKVLVIDDHILFREGLISLFRSTSDFEVVGEAGSVQEGIEKAHLLDPDIILMDFSLPDGTGLDATHSILAQNPDCKIIFLTVHEADEKLFAAVRAGAKGYLLKNVAGKSLLSSLRALDRDEVAFSRKMTSHIVEEFSHSDTRTPDGDDIFVKLTPRELDVLAELQSDASNSEVAQRLYISENTVKHHVQNVLKKLKVENRRQAGQVARQVGLKSKAQRT